MPNSPEKIAVPKFRPKWKLKDSPIILTMYIKNPPRMEFISNFIIFFIGKKNSLPTINIIIKQAKYIITAFPSKNLSPHFYATI